LGYAWANHTENDEIVSCHHILEFSRVVFQGNEDEIFERYNGRETGPLIDLTERNHALKLVAQMRN
jgi:hypothetical protein